MHSTLAKSMLAWGINFSQMLFGCRSSNVLHYRALLQKCPLIRRYHTSVQFDENYTSVQFDENYASVQFVESYTLVRFDETIRFFQIDGKCAFERQPSRRLFIIILILYLCTL